MILCYTKPPLFVSILQISPESPESNLSANQQHFLLTLGRLFKPMESKRRLAAMTREGGRDVIYDQAQLNQDNLAI